MNTNISFSRNSTAARQSRGYSKIYATLLLFLVIIAAFVTSCKKDDFEDEISGLCPTVTTDPANGAVNVAVNKTIGLTFNTDMRGSTVNTTTVLLVKEGTTTPIAGVVGPGTDGKSFTFNPNIDLEPFITYKGTVTVGAKDTLRSSMAANYEWSFKTVPRVTLSTAASTPTAGGTVSGEGDFAQGSSVTVTATANAGSAFINWTKLGAPTVSLSSEASYQFNMDGNVALVANFAPLASSYTVTLITYTNGVASNVGGTTTGSGTYVAGSVVQIRAIANSNHTFINWTENVGNTLVSIANPHTLPPLTSNRTIRANFTTPGPIFGAGIGPTAVPLGTASNFTILTKSGITNVSQSSITGNIGVSPITGAAITGLSCPEVSGIIYTVDAAGPACRVINKTLVDNAVSDMEAAFTFANGLSVAPINELGGGNLNAATAPLAPGLYKWSSNVSITTEITLSGTANDRWVFQIAGNLTVNNDAKIKLLGGADPKNITWVVSGATTSFGTNSDVSGNFLTSKLISLNTGAKVTGRLLSQSQVTLIKNTVIQP